MSLARIRDEFRVPARLGARVTVNTFTCSYDGTVTGSHEDEILVKFDDGLEGYVWPEDIIFHKS